MSSAPPTVTTPDLSPADEAWLREFLAGARAQAPDTLGLEVIGTLSPRKSQLSKGSVIGRGKLVELARWTGGTGIVPSAAPKAKSNRQKPEEAVKIIRHLQGFEPKVAAQLARETGLVPRQPTL